MERTLDPAECRLIASDGFRPAFGCLITLLRSFANHIIDVAIKNTALGERVPHRLLGDRVIRCNDVVRLGLAVPLLKLNESSTHFAVNRLITGVQPLNARGRRGRAAKSAALPRYEKLLRKPFPDIRETYALVKKTFDMIKHA